MLNILFKKSRDSDLKMLEEPVAGSWINVVNPTKKEVNFLMEKGVPLEFIKSSLDLSEQPRVDEESGAKLLIIQVPEIVEGDLETAPLGIVITSEYVITISKTKNKILKTFVNNPKGFYTTKRSRFLFQLFWTTVKSYLGYLNYIDNTLDKFGTSVTKSLGNQEIMDLLNLQKALTYFKTASYGNQRVLDKIMTGKFLKLYEQDEDILDDIIIDNKQVIEMIDTYLAITANTMAAYGSIVGNNLNLLMKLLAVLSISMAIPTIIASMFGMNVALPFQSNPIAFWGIFFSSVVFSFVTFYGFFKLRWI
ncbi:MAG: magnesium transporter CorA family protein [Candidatus Altiarchaeota archaeon]|nr:magnesium transporter CorA family protein [Candidatus Altiarchaeota archaeon]